MSYHDLLYQYGAEQESAETRIYIYTQSPNALKEKKDIIYRDKDAAANIARLEKLIEDLKDYRQALSARYGELETMPYTRLLKLERYPNWKGRIDYIVSITRQYSDKTDVRELYEVFPGKERKKAFDLYNALLKQYPGIHNEMDVEKRSWEK